MTTLSSQLEEQLFVLEEFDGVDDLMATLSCQL
jgi:hypothetical protein